MNKITISSIFENVKEKFSSNKFAYISLFIATVLLVVLNELNIIHGIAKYAIIPLVGAYQLGHYISEKKHKNA